MMYTSLAEDNDALNRRVGELESRVAELEAAFLKYGSHAALCASANNTPSDFTPCDCGWPEARAVLAKEGE